MMLRFLFRFFIVVAIWNISGPVSSAKTLDHEVFLREMENSSNHTYSQCINEYDEYLKKFPDDISVLIEKCKFIQYAQYEYDEDYNPNQAAFDSCVAYITEKFPNHPDVLIFQSSYLWGDDLKDIFAKAEYSITESPLVWSKKNLGILYFEMADTYYWEEEYDLALNFIEIAIQQDEKYKSSLEYAMILIDLNRKKEAIEVLKTLDDTNLTLWELNQKANLYLQIEVYDEALKIFKGIHEADSTFNNNFELAHTLEAIGEFDVARSYLVADTNQHWDRETAIRNLLIHDIRYQDGKKCIQTYNEYRNIGFLMDPIGFYRLKIFFLHPFQVLKFRDIISILTFIITLGILLIIPSIWILPVYFIGHHFNYIGENKSTDTLWGLKAFWFVSAGYLIATFFSYFADPELIYSHFNSSLYTAELNPNQLALLSLIFFAIFSFFGFASLYKQNFNILLSKLWSIRKSIIIGVGVFLIFRIVVGIYVKIGVSIFDITLEDIATIPNIFFSTQQSVEAILSSYGKLTGFLIICLLVPLYEEIIFRGVILDSCQTYINFNSANIIQALLFATIHLNLFLFPVFFLFGIIAGILRRKSGGLLPGIIMHVANNSLVILVLMVR